MLVALAPVVLSRCRLETGPYFLQADLCSSRDAGNCDFGRN